MVLVVMGVAGSGKTTVGSLLARRLGRQFQEGDSLHPRSNVEKMRGGRSLTDEDRAPWLERVAGWIDERLDAGGSGVVTCSALKRSYRDLLNRRGSGVVFVFLDVSKELASERLRARQGHFMPAAMLDSQFADLERPGAREPVISVDASQPPESIVEQVLSLRLDR